MKLFRLKIENEDGFRSLQKGFEIYSSSESPAKNFERIYSVRYDYLKAICSSFNFVLTYVARVR